MKRIRYTMCTPVNRDTADNPIWEDVLYPVEMGWNEENEEIAKRESYNGEYTIEDDGQAATPSQLDVIEAQVTYTAMMTDTLLEA